MVLRSLCLRNFRSYGEEDFEFRDHVNVIVGPNGTGKTNLLEAIYVAMHGVSFRVADKQLPQHEQDWFRIDAEFDDQKRTIRYQQTNSPAKQVVVNDGAKRRFTRALRLPVVLFEPDMLRVLSGSPARRRQMLDGLIMQWFDDGATLLRKYDRVLLQRNNILRDAYEMDAERLDDQLFAWDVSFAELASQIETYRQQIITILSENISDIYSQIAQKSQSLEIEYHSPAQTDKNQILAQLRSHRRLDATRGYTTIGPHRSDFIVLLNGQPSDSTASRGEQRSIVLSIKYIEVMELEKRYATAPILLLDDITGELDTGRVKSLLGMIKDHQVIATAAHSDALLSHVAEQQITL